MERRRIGKALSRYSLFGPPPILEGEDAAAYDELFGRVCAAVKPIDVIDEMFVADVVALEWEVLRWRRLKLSLVRARGLTALEYFLRSKLEYEFYKKHFTDELARVLEDNRAEDQAEDFVQTLACACARNDPNAVDEVVSILDGVGLNLDHILDRAKARKAEELAHEYAQREPDAVKVVHKLLAKASVSIEDLTLGAMAEELDNVERIDRLAAIAESRRNASLCEIDRRRVVLGEKLRRSLQAVEDQKFEVIDATPAKGKNAA
jgi:hypothetical protein